MTGLSWVGLDWLRMDVHMHVYAYVYCCVTKCEGVEEEQGGLGLG